MHGKCETGRVVQRMMNRSLLWEKINRDHKRPCMPKNEIHLEVKQIILGLHSLRNSEVILLPDSGFAVDQPLFKVLGLHQGTSWGGCSHRAYIQTESNCQGGCQ